MSCYQAICFDLFDTIIQFDEGKYTDVRRDGILKTGWDPNAFSEAWNATHQAALEGVFLTLDERYRAVLDRMKNREGEREILPQVMKLELAAIRAAVKPVPGMKDLLIYLLRKKKRLGLISNASCIGPVILEQLNWQHYFDEQVFSFAEKLWKPNPDIYLLACDRLGYPPQQAAFVSDGDGGELTGASDAGLDPIRFDPGNLYPDQPLPPGCFICRNTDELKYRLMI
ncbi:MAG TPA: HAD hydrolase-like protein [bacterium]|nr:HAD hydrolase-like protein [bacterium]